MMEKESMGGAFVLALTYSQETEHSRRSAEVFDYRDVQEFLWNLRRQIRYHTGQTGAVSFIAAGEKGDRKDRCHWHLVLFTSVDIFQFGKWSAKWGPVEGAANIITPPGEPGRNRLWSLWPHGFVVVQEPDYGGMRYALAYALKDQFNVRNSEGTGRQGKAETFGTGYLVMSKKPPIGARFVDAYVERCRALGVVPPTKRLSVDGLDRPFWPTGLLSARLLEGLASVNAEIVEKTGANAAGWSTLLHESRLNDDELELLGVIGHGEAQERREAKERQREIASSLRLEDKSNWRRWRAAREAHNAAVAGRSAVIDAEWRAHGARTTQAKSASS